MDRNQEAEMSLVGHLTELRTRLIICLSALVFSVVGAFFFSRPILAFLTKPIDRLAAEPGRPDVINFMVDPDGTMRIHDPRPAGIKLDQLSQKRFDITFLPKPQQNLSSATFHYGEKASQKLYYSKPMDPFMMLLKVALIGGILIVLPILIWQIWAFIKPGLKKKEQKIVKPLLSGAVVLFPIGAGFAYFMVTLVLKVMQAYSVANVSPLLNVFDYISLLFNMMLVFGFIFEIPLALAIGSRIGLVTPKFLMHYRRHAYVVLAIGAMVISPGGDPFTMIAALFPLVALYEVSIAISIPMARLHKRDQENEDEEEEEEETREERTSETESSSTGNSQEDWATQSVDESGIVTEEGEAGTPANDFEEGWTHNEDGEETEGGEEEEEEEGEEDEEEYEEGEEEEEETEEVAGPEAPPAEEPPAHPEKREEPPAPPEEPRPENPEEKRPED